MSCLPTSRLWAPNLWVVNQRHLLFHSFTFLLLLKYLPLCMHKVQSVISWVSGVSRALALLSSPKGCQPGWSCSALSCVSRQPRVHMMTYWSWRRGQAGWRGQGEELEGTGLGWTSMYNVLYTLVDNVWATLMYTTFEPRCTIAQCHPRFLQLPRFLLEPKVELSKCRNWQPAWAVEGTTQTILAQQESWQRSSGIWNHIWSCQWILFNPSQGVISVCWLQSGGRNVSGLWPKIRSLFLRNLFLLSWWLNDRACIVLVHPGSAGRWLEDFLPGDRVIFVLLWGKRRQKIRFNKRSYVLPVLCCPAFLSNSKDKI